MSITLNNADKVTTKLKSVLASSPLSSKQPQSSNRNILSCLSQDTKTLISRQLSGFFKYIKSQTIQLTQHYQNKLSYQQMIYEQEIYELKQQIQRQYKVIGLMKQQVEDLMIMLNQQRQIVLIKKNHQDNLKQQLAFHNQNETEDNHNQMITNNYSQHNKTNTHTLNNLISGLQTIIQEETERTLMSEQNVSERYQIEQKQKYTEFEQDNQINNDNMQNNNHDNTENNNHENKQNIDQTQINQDQVRQREYHIKIEDQNSHNINTEGQQSLKQNHNQFIQNYPQNQNLFPQIQYNYTEYEQTLSPITEKSISSKNSIKKNMKRKKSIDMLVYRTTNTQRQQNQNSQPTPKSIRNNKSYIKQRQKQHNKTNDELKLYDFLEQILMSQKNNHKDKKKIQSHHIDQSKDNQNQQIAFCSYQSRYNQSQSQRFNSCSYKDSYYTSSKLMNQPKQQSNNNFNSLSASNMASNSNTNRFSDNKSQRNTVSFIKKKQKNFTVIQKLSPSPLKQKQIDDSSNRKGSFNKSNNKSTNNKNKSTNNNNKSGNYSTSIKNNHIKISKTSTSIKNKQNIIPVTRQMIYRMNQQIMNKQTQNILQQEQQLLFKKINVNNYISNQFSQQNQINSNKTKRFLQQFRKTFNQCIGVMKANKKYSTKQIIKNSKMATQQHYQNNECDKSKQVTMNYYSQKNLSQLYEKSPSFNQSSLEEKYLNNHKQNINQSISMIRLTTDQELQHHSYQIKNHQHSQFQNSNNKNYIHDHPNNLNHNKNDKNDKTQGQLYTTFGKQSNLQQHCQQYERMRKNSKNSVNMNKKIIQNKKDQKSHQQTKKQSYNPKSNPYNLKYKSNLHQQCLVNNLIKDLTQDTNKFLVGHKKLQIKYDGQKKQNIRHGHGTLFYSNGLCYEGEFKNNMREGYGILKFNHIQLYSGDWQNDQLSGQGKIRNCAIINKKKSNNNNMSTSVNSSLLLQKWISYCGQFQSNRFHGEGTLYLQGGQKFIGQFINGAANGQGSLIKKNGQIQAGIWKNGILIERYKDQHLIE